MKNKPLKDLFRRYSDNPIIKVQDLPYCANSVFNAGAIRYNNNILLLMRVEDRKGISHLTLAKSNNGINNWEIDTKPTLLPEPKEYPEEIWGIEDPRITYLEEDKLWGIVFTAYSMAGPLISLATTEDFKNFNKYGPIMPPENKDAALFPIKFNNQWAMLHRPVSYIPSFSAHIWISFSPDLKYWGNHKIIIRAREGAWWDANKVGLCPPPLRTDEGWLILYHGVKETASGIIYRLGLALLDIENPFKLIARSDEWIFSPLEKYERCGDVNNVVFPCGWILKGDELYLYYGSADSSIALATAYLSDLLDWLNKHNSLAL